MKQSVDLMNSIQLKNSMKLMHSRHNNSQSYPTSLARRALLLLCVFLMSVGSAWGQIWQEGSAFSGTTISPKYEKSNQTEVTIDLYSDIISNLPSLTVGNIYVRWDLKDASGNYVALSQNQWGDTDKVYIYHSPNYHYMLGNDNKFNYYYKAQSWYSETDDALTNTLKVELKRLNTLSSLDGCILECFVSDSWSGLGTGGLTSSDTEPAFKLKAEVIFNESGKKPDTFKGSLKSTGTSSSGGATVGSADVLATSATSATLDLAAALATVSETVKYARFYLIKEGATVDPTGKLTVTGGTAGPETEHGFYISKPAGISSSDLSGKVKLDLTAGEFEDYQVMCVFSTDEATSLPTKEPDWDLQYAYTFEYPFKGDASGATKVEKTFTLLPSVWTTDPREFSIDFDFANSKILLKDKDNSATLSSVSLDETFWDSYTDATLGGSDKFYIRWFLKSKSTGVETYIANSIRNINGASTYKNCAKEKYGRFWSTGMSSEKDLATIMRIKLDGTPDGGSSFDVRDYDLVCTISTVGGETLNGSQVTMEPATMQMQYTFHFEDRPFPATNLDDPSLQTIYKNVLYDKTIGLKITQYGDNGYVSVASDLGVASDGIGNLYSRWYVADADGNIVSDLEDWNFSATKTYTKNDDYGHYILGFESWNAAQYDPTFDYPSTYTDTQKDYTQYKFVCLMTLNRDGMVPTAAPLTNEPETMQLKYVYSFLSPQDYYANFPADNIATVNTIYKNAFYTKIDDGAGNTIGGQITPSLFANLNTVMGDLGVDRSTLKANGYVRWYLTDNSGNILSDISDWGFSATKPYTKNLAFGHYIHLTDLPDNGGGADFDPTFTLPSTGYDYDTDYKNLRVACVITTDLSGEDLPMKEPTAMQVKYVYNLICTEEDYEALPFVHYKGQSGRDWIVPEGSTGSMTQKIWNSETGASEDFSGDIRQGVHTWEYNLYVIPGVERPLILPFEKYENTGNNLEPYAYFRWYDWKKDTKVVNDNFTFAGVGTALSAKERGLFALNIGANPIHANIGVTFNPTTAFTGSIDIACDVSKYSDGLTTPNTTTYLVHEPTLSNRYIYHVYPASVIAGKLDTSKSTLMTAWDDIIEGSADNATMKARYENVENTMFKLLEDAGKVVVSLDGTQGSFALRMQEHELANYVIKIESNYYVSNYVQWYSFFEDADGVWIKKLGNTVSSRILTFSYDQFIGKYTNLRGDEWEGTTDVTHTITEGKKFHVVGFAGEKSDFDVMKRTGIYAPVVHYELNFLNAPAISISDLANNIERTDEYMKYHYQFAGVIDFDGNPETNDNVTGHEGEYYSTTNWSDAPTSSANNMTWTPFQWDEIQYGFCYPQLTSTIKNGSGGLYASPEHGDYIIVKSMNAPGISDDNSSITDPHRYDWWSASELYDYTHTVTDNTKYGSFLYTDASDESRTIATLPFFSDLCGGSSIYFTAAVANMTSGTIKPQLLIRILGIDGNGNRHNVVSFHTCDIHSTGATDGQWNQVYGESSIPITFDEEITHFVAEVINYANDTNGADFAIDQIAIYTSTSKVMIKQTNGSCDDPLAGELKVYMDAEGIQNAYGKSDTEKTIYWRICKSEDGSVVTGPGMYPRYDNSGNPIADDGSFTYGVSKVVTNYTASDVKEESARESDAYGWYSDTNNDVFFQIANKNFPALEEGGNYYVSVYSPHEDFDETKEGFWGGLHWGASSKCSVFSPFFIPRSQYVTYTDGNGGPEGGEIAIACGGAMTVSNVEMILKVPDTNEPTGFKSVNTIHFDFAFVPMATWTSTTATFSHGGTNYSYDDLRTALAAYRGVSSAYKEEAGLNSGFSSVNPTYYNLLDCAIQEGILSLAYSTTFNHTFSGTDFTVVCLPVEQQVSMSTGTTAVCSPFEVVFNLVGSSPELELGFKDVTYPSTGYDKRVVRIGMEQLTNLKTGGYKLHIPVKSYKDKDKATAVSLYFGSQYLTISATNDPTNPAVGTNVAKIVNPDDASATPFVDADHMYLELDLSSTNCAVDFHEGFEYEVATTYFDSRDVSNTGRCEGDLFLVIKVVPEFVTWNPQQLSGDYYNVNWNNDTNWQRSTRAELYKDENVTGKKQNTATAGHPAGYDNNGENTLSSINTTPQTYVPMKFSYVTLPADCRAPSLINMNLTSTPVTTSVYNGGVLLAGDLGTDRSPNDGGTSAATQYIKFDMLVRYSYTSSDNQNKCQGHLKKDGITVVGAGDENIYDCEKFYGNICREIYFKPGAELINQQRLSYQLAWVEKLLDRNRWYMLSAPLKGTYAGDMYLPATAITDYSLGTSATVTGKQVTEAFQPISFNTTTYSRTNYPVYQRSWDHNADGARAYTETTDPRATQYSGGLLFDGEVTSTFAQWTHVYNDVQVQYDALQGFVLRAHKKDGTSGEQVLFRWPKFDTSYSYYNYDDTEGTVNQGVTKGTSNYGRFVTDGLDNKAAMTKALDQPNANTDNQYFLVGNPYMASIDMEKFFTLNPTLNSSYWTMDGNPSTAQSTGLIKPMESFFVKTTTPTTEIVFNNSVMIDGNAPAANTSAPQLTQALTLTAKNEKGQSVATVSQEEGQNVETLFDSNLAEVPMVYTVADGKAVSIHHLTADVEAVCFGVTCSGDEAVDVRLQGLDNMGEIRYVFDAADGSTTEVSEGDVLSIVPNEYGRYFLTSKNSTTGMKDEVAAGIRVSVHGGVVKVSAAQPLGTVRAVSTGGALMHQETGCGQTVAFRLQQGVYVVEVDGAAGRKTLKIFVR